MTAYEQATPDVQPFLLTPRTLDQLGNFRDESPVEYERARTALYEAQVGLFTPFLTRTPEERLPFEFERLAYAFIPCRIFVNAMLLKWFGARQFEARYLAAFMRMTESFVSEASSWGLEPGEVEAVLRSYLASAIRLISIARMDATVQAEHLSTLLISATKADFGLTAMFFAVEKSIPAEKSTLRVTFDLTKAALTQYEELASKLWEGVANQSRISGSLRIEGDLDEALRKLSADELGNQKPQ